MRRLLVGLVGAVALWGTVSAHARAGVRPLGLAYADTDVHLVWADGTHARRLTYSLAPREVHEVAWSSDGDRLAYVKASRVSSEVYVVRAGGGRARRIASFEGAHRRPAFVTGLAWSSEGRRVALFVTGGHSGVYLAEVDGGTSRKVAAIGDAYPVESLAWFADGRIVGCSDFDPRRLRRRSAGSIQIEIYGGDCKRKGPFWSPDGSHYLLSRPDPRGDDQLVLYDRRGRRASLTNDVPDDDEVKFSNCCAAWSRDGAKVLFLSNRGASEWPYDLFVVDADGGEQRRLTWNQDGEPGFPTLSPDGSMVLFRSWDVLRTLSAAGGPSRRVARVAAPAAWAWRPTGVARKAPSQLGTADAPPRLIHVPRRYYGVRPGRLRDVQVVRRDAPDGLADVSHDGRLVSVWMHQKRRGQAFGVFDSRTGRIRWLATGYGGWPGAGRGLIAPDSRWLLVRRGTRVYAVSTRTGRTRFLASAPERSRISWLDDGSLAFFDRAGRLVVAGPATSSWRRSFRLPAGSFAPSVSPDGKRVLYVRRCRVWLADLDTGNRKLIGPRRGPPGGTPSAWSPDSLHFLLDEGSLGNRCRGVDWRHGGAGIYDVTGRKLFTVWGWAATWSSDGSAVISYGGTTGTATMFLQGLSVYVLRTGKLVALIGDRVAGPAFLGGRGLLVYRRYAPGLDAEKVQIPPPRLYVARLGQRWR